VNVFFDVDDTLIAYDGSLRPLVRETFERIILDGHLIQCGPVSAYAGMWWTSTDCGRG
jgi:FMN phosphatase YigB (HAD superfamily)